MVFEYLLFIFNRFAVMFIFVSYSITTLCSPEMCSTACMNWERKAMCRVRRSMLFSALRENVCVPSLTIKTMLTNDYVNYSGYNINNTK